MKTLTLASSNLAPALNETHKEVIKGLSGKKFKDLHPVESVKIIVECLQYIYFTKGFGTPTKESINQTALELSKHICRKYAGYNESDIRTACKLGAVGELKKDGDLNVISVEMILTWLGRYQTQIRNEALAIQRKYLDDCEKQRNEQREKDGKLGFLKWIIQMFESIELLKQEPKKNVSLMFDHLRKNGILNLTKDEYDTFWERSYHLYKNYEEQENLFVITTREDCAKELALYHWIAKQKGKLIIDETELKLKLI
jgi:hypothetical protein